MEIWLLSFAGGFVGSLFMDITEAFMARYGIGSGVTGAYIGRWVSGLLHGRLYHRDIARLEPVAGEMRIAQLFHYVVGGGVVALFYPLLLLLFGVGIDVNHVLSATLFGLATSVLPWGVLMPSFGWGFFGIRAPQGSRPLLAPLLSHVPYGFGIGLTLALYYKVMSA